MAYIGTKPADKPLTSADITDGIITTTKIADSNITSAKITDATIVNGDIANATIALAKLSATGTASASTFLRGDNAWGEAGAAAGQVIQVLSTTISGSNLTTTSTSFVAISGLSVSITPASSSNKILILSSIQLDPEYNVAATIYRGATNLGGSSGFFYGGYHDGLDSSISYLDSPATTSAITYQVYWLVDGGTANFYGTSRKATITVMEIKG